jgi:hypothetical protein
LRQRSMNSSERTLSGVPSAWNVLDSGQIMNVRKYPCERIELRRRRRMSSNDGTGSGAGSTRLPERLLGATAAEALHGTCPFSPSWFSTSSRRRPSSLSPWLTSLTRSFCSCTSRRRLPFTSLSLRRATGGWSLCRETTGDAGDRRLHDELCDGPCVRSTSRSRLRRDVPKCGLK